MVKKRLYYIENLKNTNKIIESDPISYFLDSVEKLKISLHFLLYLKNVMLIEYDDREIKIKELIRLV
jgi:tRNA splicing endonuclease